MLHLETKLFDVLPLLRLLPIIHHDVGLIWRRGGSKADPAWTPVLELLLCACLNTLDELLNCLERASMAQEQIDERGKPIVMIHRPSSPGLVCLAAARGPSLVSTAGAKILPWPSTL